MTVKEIQERVQEIRRVAESRDYELAHGLQDTLLENVLEDIARSGVGFHAARARAALEVTKIEFPRHCA